MAECANAGELLKQMSADDITKNYAKVVDYLETNPDGIYSIPYKELESALDSLSGGKIDPSGESLYTLKLEKDEAGHAMIRDMAGNRISLTDENIEKIEVDELGVVHITTKDKETTEIEVDEEAQRPSAETHDQALSFPTSKRSLIDTEATQAEVGHGSSERSDEFGYGDTLGPHGNRIYS